MATIILITSGSRKGTHDNWPMNLLCNQFCIKSQYDDDDDDDDNVDHGDDDDDQLHIQEGDTRQPRPPAGFGHLGFHHSASTHDHPLPLLGHINHDDAVDDDNGKDGDGRLKLK